MKHEHRLGWYESFLPLGPAIQQNGAEVADTSCQDVETGDHTPSESAVAPTPAAPVHPSGVAPWKTEPPSEPGWYVIARPESLKENHWRAMWDGSLWTEWVGMIDSTVRGPIPPEKSGLIVWLRRATAQEAGE